MRSYFLPEGGGGLSAGDVSQSLLNEVLFPTPDKFSGYDKKTGSQSLLNEVLFPTRNEGWEFKGLNSRNPF